MCVYVTLCSDQLIICMCVRMISIFNYICVKWFIICFGKLCLASLSEFVNSKNLAFLDSILMYIMHNCLQDVWLTAHPINYNF